MVCTLDREGRFTSVNRAGEKLCGYSADELVGTLAVELIPPEARDDAVRQFQARLDGAADHAPQESALLTRDGRRVPIEVTSTIVRRSGRTAGVIGLVRDVSERVRSEEALLESERRFRTAFDFAAIGVALVAPDGRFLQVNDALCDLVGYTADELLTLTFQDITHPDDLEADVELARQVLDGEIRTYQMEKRYVHKLGHVVWILLSVSLVRKSDGSPLHFISQIQDITDQKRSQGAISQGKLQLAEAQHLAHIGSWEWDAAADLVTWSDELYSIFGVDRDIGQLTYASYVQTIHPEERAMVEDTIERAFDTGEPFETEHRIVLPDGGVRWIHGRGEVERDDQGVAMRGTAQDITERKQAEEERDRLRDELHHAQKLEALGRLAGGVAHDFNNMLTAIRGYSELLLANLEPGHPSRHDAEQVRRAAEHASSLPKQLLAFSRKQVLEPVLLDLTSIVSDASDLLRHVVGETVDIVTTTVAQPACIHADPSQIEQALVNLAVNARDAMPDGGTITIATRNADVTAGVATEHGVAAGPYVVISVSDTGTGMDEGMKARVFEPFFTTKAPGQGSGLGLATVYGIVRQSGGFIRLESEPGIGSNFEIYFPRRVAEVERESAAPSQLDPRSATSATVLLVDDQELVRDAACAVLENAGWEVLSYASGPEALELCEGSDVTVDVLVTDVVMPGMGGPELAQRVLRRRPGTPVVLMSGYADDAPVVGSEGGVFMSFLQKPFAPSELVQAVQAAVDRTASNGHRDVGETIRCLIADDHPAVLDSVSRFLESHGIEVGSRVSRGDEALDEIAAKQPAIALLDIGMLPMSGIEVARRVADTFPEIRTVLYTGHRDSALLEQALDAGVRAFVLKESPLEELLRALEAVANGGTYVDPELSVTLASAHAVGSLSPLTPREREVLALLADGMTNDKVGTALGISPETVQSHVRNTMGKLEANTRTEAVATAIRQSFID